MRDSGNRDAARGAPDRGAGDDVTQDAQAGHAGRDCRNVFGARWRSWSMKSGSLEATIVALDRQLAPLAATYLVAARLETIPGVGVLTATAPRPRHLLRAHT